MNHNRTTTQYFAYGKKADGTWKAIMPMKYTKEEAEEVIANYQRNTVHYPEDYPKFNDYKVMTRTVVTTYGEWEDA